jgi:hypothetical protein
VFACVNCLICSGKQLQSYCDHAGFSSTDIYILIAGDVFTVVIGVSYKNKITETKTYHPTSVSIVGAS